MKTVIAVIAGSRQQFNDCLKHWFHHDDFKKFVCVTSMRDCRTLRPVAVLRLGTHYDLRDIHEIEMYLKYRMEGNNI